MEEHAINVDCQELKNIKYKTMLLKGAPMAESKSSNDMTNLDKFLENDKINNVNEPWCKLNKTVKTKKLIEYVECYKQTNNLSNDESELLITFLKDCLDRKKLLRVKDVVYDRETGNVKEIPALFYVKTTKHFTLKNIDKRVSTLRSLAPKKSIHGTVRKSEAKNDDSEEDDDN